MNQRSIFSTMGPICVALGFGLAGGVTPMVAGAQAARDNRDIVQAFAHLAYENKQVRAAYESYVAPDLIQHNPNVGDGREAAIKDLEGIMTDPGARFDIKHVVVDGDYAVLHFRGALSATAQPAAVMEMFRLKDGKIVEHWDVFQAASSPAPKNPHPYF